MDILDAASGFLVRSIALVTAGIAVVGPSSTGGYVLAVECAVVDLYTFQGFADQDGRSHCPDSWCLCGMSDPLALLVVYARYARQLGLAFAIDPHLHPAEEALH